MRRSVYSRHIDLEKGIEIHRVMWSVDCHILHSLKAASTTLCSKRQPVALLQFVDIVDLYLVHTLLHDPPNLTIDRVHCSDPDCWGA